MRAVPTHPECSAPCHTPVNLVPAKLQSIDNEDFQGGKEQAVVMREAAHIGQLAQISQRSAREGRAEVDAGVGQLAVHRREKRALWALARTFILFSDPANASIWDQKGLGKSVWRT